MSGITIDLILCAVTYLILLRIIVWRWNLRKGKDNGNNNDDEGGLPVYNGPELDFPPGVCLPGDGPSIKKTEEELVS